MRGARILLLATVTSCSWGSFDDLKDSAWVQLAERDDTQTSGDYGVEVTAMPPASGMSGIRYEIAAGNPAGLAEVTFDGKGNITNQIGFNGEFGGKGALEPLDDKSAPYALEPYVGDSFLAGVQGASQVIKYQAGLENGVALADGSPTNIGRSIAIGNLGLGSTNPDVVSIGVLSLTVIPNGDKPARTCTMKPPNQLNDPLVGFEALAVAKVDATSDHDQIIVAAAELAQQAQPFILVIEAKDIVDGQNCPETGFPSVTNPAPESIAVGDVDGNGKMDIVGGSFSSGNGKVVVYLDYQKGQTPANMEIPSDSDDESSGARGSRLRIANIDGDAGNELIVGDSGATVNGISLAGQVQIYRWGACSGGGEVRGPACLVRTLFDPSPARNDQFGRSLAIGTFKSSKGDRTILAVAEKAKLWVYFRISPEGSDPRE